MTHDGPWDMAVKAAVYASLNSRCQSKRGAVIWHRVFPRSIALGWNRLPFGKCSDTTDCKKTCGQRAVHAEQYAILEAASRSLEMGGAYMLHVKTVDGILVPSGEPSCLECAKLIYAAGFDSIWLYHESGWRQYEAGMFYDVSIAGAARKAAFVVK